MSSTLLTKQHLFASLVPKLIQKALDMGFQVTIGDVYRDPRAFGVQGQRKAYGQAWSAHKFRLAIDLNLFRDGEYLMESNQHRDLGLYWESLHESCVWGGRFDDGNHYSFSHQGVA